MGRLENQLHNALSLAAERLSIQGRLEPGSRPGKEALSALVQALKDPAMDPVELPMAETEPKAAPGKRSATSPRQLIGQPAARGLARGRVCVVQGPDDFRRFEQGDVMVCDAIQPTMTHLVTLASAIVERRGGMLIHGAIIARELGIPCVNGVPDATELLTNGEEVSVDGHLGIVTVGPAEFDLELG
jgi:pyruvate,water dikinase